MDKKIKFSEQPLKAKIIYGVVVAILCVTAIVIGIVSVASQKDDTPDDGTTPPVSDGGDSTEGEGNGSGDGEGEGDSANDEGKEPAKLSFVSPVVGELTASHSTDAPVFSNTLNEWRVHTGIDISTDNGAEVFAAAEGTVSRIYSDPLLGKTVEITHDGGMMTRYSNLSSAVSVKEGDTVSSGAKIGTVGDTSISELAEEPHLHFEFLVDGVSVNPLDYISEDSKEASLGLMDV